MVHIKYNASVVQRQARYFTSSHPNLLPNWVPFLEFKMSNICIILSSRLEPREISTEHKFN